MHRVVFAALFLWTTGLFLQYHFLLGGAMCQSSLRMEAKS